MTTLFAAISAMVSLFMLAGGVYCYVRIKRVSQTITETLENIFVARNQDNMSVFTQTVNEILDGSAQRIGYQVQAAIRGSIGGSMKGVNAQLEKVAADSDPTLAVAANLPKSLKKNPLAMAGLQFLLNRAGGGNAGGNNNQTSQAKFSL